MQNNVQLCRDGVNMKYIQFLSILILFGEYSINIYYIFIPFVTCNDIREILVQLPEETVGVTKAGGAQTKFKVVRYFILRNVCLEGLSLNGRIE